MKCLDLLIVKFCVRVECLLLIRWMRKVLVLRIVFVLLVVWVMENMIVVGFIVIDDMFEVVRLIGLLGVCVVMMVMLVGCVWNVVLSFLFIGVGMGVVGCGVGWGILVVIGWFFLWI